MTNEKFNEVVEDQLNYCKSLLGLKSIEYNGDLDRFHNFNSAAVLRQCNRKQALAGMMAKHTISIYDMCKDGEYPVEKWTEKITDHINYLLLLKAMIIEEAENEKN